MSLNFVKTPDPQFQKAKAQDSVLISNLHRQGYREVKLHMMLVKVLGTIYKNHTDNSLANLNLDNHKIKELTNKRIKNKRSIRHASALINTRYAPQYNLNNNSQGAGLGATAHNPLTHTKFFLLCVCAVGGCLVRAPM